MSPTEEIVYLNKCKRSGKLSLYGEWVLKGCRGPNPATYRGPDKSKVISQLRKMRYTKLMSDATMRRLGYLPSQLKKARPDQTVACFDRIVKLHTKINNKLEDILGLHDELADEIQLFRSFKMINPRIRGSGPCRNCGISRKQHRPKADGGHHDWAPTKPRRTR